MKTKVSLGLSCESQFDCMWKPRSLVGVWKKTHQQIHTRLSNRHLTSLQRFAATEHSLWKISLWGVTSWPVFRSRAEMFPSDCQSQGVKAQVFVSFRFCPFETAWWVFLLMRWRETRWVWESRTLKLVLLAFTGLQYIIVDCIRIAASLAAQSRGRASYTVWSMIKRQQRGHRRATTNSPCKAENTS